MHAAYWRYRSPQSEQTLQSMVQRVKMQRVKGACHIANLQHAQSHAAVMRM
jgi:hypothetical protein